MFSFGLIIYHIVVLIVNLKLLIMTKTWQRNFIFSLVASTAILPFFCLTYSSFKWNFMNDDMFGHYNSLFTSCAFWVTVFSVTFFAIIPDILYSVLETSMHLRNYSRLMEIRNRQKLVRG